MNEKVVKAVVGLACAGGAALVEYFALKAAYKKGRKDAERDALKELEVMGEENMEAFEKELGES